MRLTTLFLNLVILFSFGKSYGQKYQDIVVSEIMADPTPSAGLPETEYIEFFNRTAKTISVKNWRLVLGTRSLILPDSVVLPKSYVIICHKNSLAALAGHGRFIGGSSFNLPNDGAVISVYNQSNQLVYSVSYELNQWPAGRCDGGYSLEMIDTDSPCGGGENWSVSMDNAGGTPGRENSVKGRTADGSAPYIERVDVTSDKVLTLLFNERLDSLNAVRGANIELSGRRIESRKLDSPGFRKLTLELDSPLQAGKSYEITVHNLSDCSGNILREAVVKVGLPQKADSGDVVINELLFHPKENGVDYVEIYNRSGKYVGLKNWGLGSLKGGKKEDVCIFTKENVVLPPNGYLVLTTNFQIVQEQYPSENNGQFLALSALPSFPNTGGDVFLQNEAGLVLDSFVYSEEMHSPWINDAKGVSLERVDPGRSANDPENWQSAASTAGYGTPGYANSQSTSMLTEDEFWVEPEAFVPLHNGLNNSSEIKYLQSVSGKIGTIRVFDVNGRLVRSLLQNQLIGTSGSLKWDGTDSHGAVVTTGYYLILIETFDVNGNKKQFRKKVVVASEQN